MKNQNIIIGLLVISLGFNLYQFISNNNADTKPTQQMSNMGSMHRMPDGTMMSNGGGMQMNSGASMDSMMMDMTVGMKGKTGTALEKVFLEEMIVHHQGAVDMAKLLLQDKTIKPELASFANKIISAQNPEIEQMKLWLNNY
jgi:uncharacterized protein (DUF305 family)